jgi:hypothetical protein
LAGYVVFGACTPEAKVVDPPGVGNEANAGSPESSAGSPDTGGNGGVAGTASGVAGTTAGVAGTNAGTAGKQGMAGGGAAGDCAPIASPRANCVDCLAQECAAEAAACESTNCTCKKWNGVTGQMSCLLACTSLSPKMSDADACAKSCGFGNLGQADDRTHKLFDCLVNPPMGPPVCPECFPNLMP